MKSALLLLFLACGCKRAEDHPATQIEASVPSAAASGSQTVIDASDSNADVPLPTTIADAAVPHGREDPFFKGLPDLTADGGVLPNSTIREGDPALVTGKLPAEIVERIVRQNFGRFNRCYENGLRKDTTVAGRVVVHFVIDRTGGVTTTQSDPSTTMPSAEVTKCIAQAFRNLSFPQPESGTVDVVFSLIFTGGSATR
jgi:hypothetical protein